jgi:hypothetical protein
MGISHFFKPSDKFVCGSCGGTILVWMVRPCGSYGYHAAVVGVLHSRYFFVGWGERWGGDEAQSPQSFTKES